MMDISLTTVEAGKRLGVTHGRVRHLITLGRLTATKHGPLWLIREADLDAYIRHVRENPSRKRGRKSTTPPTT